MRQADLFHDMIEKELQARKPPKREEVNKTPSYVARQIATKYAGHKKRFEHSCLTSSVQDTQQLHARFRLEVCVR